MSKISTFVKNFVANEDGASLVEYSLLIGLIAALTVTLITGAGLWAEDRWGELDTAVGGFPAS